MKRVKTTAKGEIHDLHDFVRQSQQLIEEEYKRIQKHAKEDPGTAGDQGEENWRQILEQWLPPYFSVVTKGKILFASGYRSPQVDVLILRPSYPPILKNRKDFLAECVYRRNRHLKSVKSAPLSTGLFWGGRSGATLTDCR